MLVGRGSRVLRNQLGVAEQPVVKNQLGSREKMVADESAE